jgi:hypothetical protein
MGGIETGRSGRVGVGIVVGHAGVDEGRFLFVKDESVVVIWR